MALQLFHTFAADYAPILSNISSQESMAASALYLIDIFNLIEFFGVASLFGWFTFARLNYDQIEEIKGKNAAGQPRKEIAKGNLFTISNYFIISFMFYSISGIGDYLYWHQSHPFELIFTQPLMFEITIVSFMIGTLVLVAPIAIVYSIGLFGKDLSDLPHLAPFGYTLVMFGLTAIVSIFIWYTPIVCGVYCPNGPPTTIGEGIILSHLISGIIPYFGLVLGTVYYWKGAQIRKRLVVLSFVLLTMAPLWVFIATWYIAKSG